MVWICDVSIPDQIKTSLKPKKIISQLPYLFSYKPSDFYTNPH